MLLYVFLTLIALFALRALGNWRAGLLLVILVAAVQDPVRKLVPGTPGWLALATAPIVAALILGSRLSIPGWWSQFRRQHAAIAKSLLFLVLMSLPAAGISATYSAGSWMLTVLGAFSYGIIFMTVIAGFHYARAVTDIRRLLVAYCLVHGVMLSGALIEYLHLLPGWRVIGADVFGFEWRRDVWGYVIFFISGFYRSGDVMGWHAAAVTSLSLVLAFSTHGRRRWGWLIWSAWAVVALLLCGRRKMVYMLPVFVAAVLWIYWQAGRASRLAPIVGLLAIAAGSVFVIGDWLQDDTTQIRYYTETSDETLDSIQNHGFASVIGTYQQTGFLGAGLGVATPGSHHIKVERPRVWQESGPSRIMVELGVPGFVAFLTVMLTIMLGLWRVSRQLLRARHPAAPYAAGLVAFFMANVGSLTVSGQILADPFVAAFLGLLVGLVLSLPRLQGDEYRAAAVSAHLQGAAGRSA